MIFAPFVVNQKSETRNFSTETQNSPRNNSKFEFFNLCALSASAVNHLAAQLFCYSLDHATPIYQAESGETTASPDITEWLNITPVDLLSNRNASGEETG